MIFSTPPKNKILSLKVDFFRIISLLAIFGALLLLLATLRQLSFMVFCFVRGSYYILLLLFFCWLLTSVRFCFAGQSDWPVFLKRNGLNIFFLLGFTTLLFVSNPPFFRVLPDETNLLAVSRSMFFHRTVDAIFMGQWLDGKFQTIMSGIPTRPLLFPLLIQFLHLLRGFRPDHAFLLNFFIATSFFLAVFIFAKRHFGAYWAWVLVLFIAAQPIVTIAGSSGGFDFCFLLWMTLSFLCLYSFVKSPTAGGFQMLWMNLVMLAHIRYESLIFFVVCLVLLALFGYLRGIYFKKSFIFGLTPLFILPLIWQRILAISPFPELIDVPAFSWQNCVNHLRSFLDISFDFRFFYPVAVPIHVIGLVGLMIYAAFFVSRKWPKEKYQRHAFIVIAACVFCLWIVITAYHYGDIKLSTTSRFFIVFEVSLAFFAMLLWRRFLGLTRWRYCAGLFALAMFLLYHPVAMRDEPGKANVLWNQYYTVKNFIDTLPSREYFLVTDRPVLYTAQNIGAVDFDYANEHAEELRREILNKRCPGVIVIQSIDREKLLPTEATTISSDFKLQILRESDDRGSAFLRISKVIG